MRYIQASDFDNNESEMLKQISHPIAVQLDLVINITIDTGEDPSSFKTSIIKSFLNEWRIRPIKSPTYNIPSNN